MNTNAPFVPKYQKIINELHLMLDKKQLKPGDKLPSRDELMTQFGVTRATVNRAVGELLREGLLKSAQRGGTFVAGVPKIEDRVVFVIHINTLMKCLAEGNSALNFYSMFGRLFQLVPEPKRLIINEEKVLQAPEILRQYRRILWNNLSLDKFEMMSQIIGDPGRFLVLNRYYPDCDFVSINHRQAAFDLADALLARLGDDVFVGVIDMPYGDELSNRFVWTERRSGFMDACEKHQRFFRLIEFKQGNEAFNREQLAEFDSHRPVGKSAVLLSPSADIAQNVFEFLQNNHYKFNQDYFYGDFDNLDSQNRYGVAIPTVVENFRTIAEIAYEHLWTGGNQIFVPHQIINLP